MIDTSGADVYGAFSKHLNMGKKQATTHGGEYWTSCPFCGTGEDRFHVWPYRFDGGPQYWCRICRKYGDVISFLEQVECISFVEACALLEIKLEHARVSLPKRIYLPNDDAAPLDKWQDAAAKFCHKCKDSLWSEQGVNALNWLRRRGLTDDTIKRAGLGFNVSTRWEAKADWGVNRSDLEKVKLARGIVIPWHIDRQLWKVSIRRSNTDMAEDEEQGRKPRKYVAVAGGSSGIYGIDSFNLEKPTVLVEGEFDRLILIQTFLGEINALATGSTGKGQGERWALTLAQSQVVLISFDADEGGQEAARDYWLIAIPHSVLWQPWAHDVNDMYLQGLDLHEWFRLGMDVSESIMPLDKSHVSTTSNPAIDLDEMLARREISQTQQDDGIPFCPDCNTIINVGWDGKHYIHYTCGKMLS